VNHHSKAMNHCCKAYPADLRVYQNQQHITMTRVWQTQGLTWRQDSRVQVCEVSLTGTPLPSAQAVRLAGKRSKPNPQL